jgi:EAL domain-containing protein (putative c-di-GMP-specific phosphodiesterase class I)
VEDVTRALQDSQIEPERLVLEITESVFMEDVDTVLERVQQLKTLGVRLALDDFGTGYSSLGYLNRFPIDIIKIDKTFVDRMSGAVEDVALIKAIIQLSKSFGCRPCRRASKRRGKPNAWRRWVAYSGRGSCGPGRCRPTRSQTSSEGN